MFTDEKICTHDEIPYTNGNHGENAMTNGDHGEEPYTNGDHGDKAMTNGDHSDHDAKEGENCDGFGGFWRWCGLGKMDFLWRWVKGLGRWSGFN